MCIQNTIWSTKCDFSENPHPPNWILFVSLGFCELLRWSLMCAYKDVFVCTFNASVALFLFVQDLVPSCHAAFERALEEVGEMSTRNYTLLKFASTSREEGEGKGAGHCCQTSGVFAYLSVQSKLALVGIIPNQILSSLFDKDTVSYKFSSVPIFILLTSNWFVRTNFRTFEGLKTKLHWNSMASRRE